MVRFIVIIGIFYSNFLWADDNKVFVPQDIPRGILALYKTADAPDGIEGHPLHKFLAMPLNHLGLNVYYWDINQGLPDLSQYPPLRGIISWYYDEYMKNPDDYLAWASDQMIQGKKFLVIENMGAFGDLAKRPTQQDIIDKFFALLGLTFQNRWVTLDPTVVLSVDDDRYIGFEQIKPEHPKGVYAFLPQSKESRVFMSLRMLDEDFPAAIISNYGAFIYERYFLHIDQKNFLARWFVNPFYFFKNVFKTQDLPKPDVTTHVGRRIYFSHVDGDGWRNGCQQPEFAKIGKMAPEIIYEKIVAPNPDLPVTIAPIAADLDPDWVGNRKAQEMAKRYFSLAQVQGGSHTYSHPFAWEYYDVPDPAKREAEDFDVTGQKKNTKIIKGMELYDTPRAYLNKPFSLNRELLQSVAYIQKFAPRQKKLNLIQWSGSCSPNAAALEILARARLLNINGGDSRLDLDFPSYSSVCPIGFNVGGYQQIYAVNSNENTYTDGWTKMFGAFRSLEETWKRTDMPLRVKGMNLYYHLYSGEKEASLFALEGLIDYVKATEIMPLEAEYYAEIANGFYATRLVQEGSSSWRVLGRGKLNCIRFDHASDLWLDFTKCEGVLGARHYQGSLYVALDPADGSPLITTKEAQAFYAAPLDNVYYLIDSRWKVKEVNHIDKMITFEGQGYGDADMRWGVPSPGRYLVETKSDKNTTTQEFEVTADQCLVFKLKIDGINPVQFKISAMQ